MIEDDEYEDIESEREDECDRCDEVACIFLPGEQLCGDCYFELVSEYGEDYGL